MARTKESRSRGQVIPKGEGKWLVRVYIGTDEAGKRKYASKTVSGSMKQAEAALTGLQAEQDKGSLVVPSKQTLREYLTGTKVGTELPDDVMEWKGWLGSRRKIGSKTRLGYAHRIEKDILPTIGGVRLEALRRDAVERMVDTLATTRRLGRATIKHTLVVLGAAMQQAVKDGMIARNPAEGIELPETEHREATVLTAEQMEAFLEKTQGTPRHPLWHVLLTTGLRPQEALALKWEDVDLDPENGSITVARALVEVAQGKWELGKTKTQGSRRNVPLPKETIQVLKVHRAHQATKMWEQGEPRPEFVFPSERRGRANRETLDIPSTRRAWKKALKDAGLPVVRLYDSRHSHITALLKEGVHPKVAQERAGHSSIRTTMDTYSHVLPTMQRGAADTIGSLLFRRTGNS